MLAHPTAAHPAHRLLLALCLAGLTVSALAQDKPSREREALRRAQQALRSAQEESATLQRDKAALAAEKDALLKEKASLGAEQQRTAGRVAAAQVQLRDAQARVTQLGAELEALQAQLTSVKEEQIRTVAELNDAQGKVKVLRTLLEASQQKQRVLEARNKQLYDTGVAVVEMYRSRKPSETAAQQAGVLGFNLVDIENISERWMDRLEAARHLEPVTPAPGIAP